MPSIRSSNGQSIALILMNPRTIISCSDGIVEQNLGWSALDFEKFMDRTILGNPLSACGDCHRCGGFWFRLSLVDDKLLHYFREKNCTYFPEFDDSFCIISHRNHFSSLNVYIFRISINLEAQGNASTWLARVAGGLSDSNHITLFIRKAIGEYIRCHYLFLSTI